MEYPGVLFISTLDVSPAYMRLFSHVGILEVTSVGQNEVKGLLIWWKELNIINFAKSIQVLRISYIICLQLDLRF